MANTIGTFDFRISGVKSDPLADIDIDIDIAMPTVHITLRSWTTGSDDKIQVSSGMSHPGEIDKNIELLKADLDVVGRRAKAQLARAIELAGKEE